MLLCEINPFIRYADDLKYIPKSEVCQARDYRLFFIMSDGWKINIDGKLYDAPTSCSMIIPPGCKYRFFSENQENILYRISVNFDYTQSHNDIAGPFEPIPSNQFDSRMIFEKTTFSDVTLLNEPIVIEHTEHLKGKLEELIKEYNYKKQFFHEIALYSALVRFQCPRVVYKTRLL